MKFWPSRKKRLEPAGRGGWRRIIGESYAGAWQQNVEVNQEDVRNYFAVYACITLIAGDISKLGIAKQSKGSNGIWNDIATPDILLRPNAYQSGLQFRQWWMTSKLAKGNTYALKRRNGGKVTALYLLDPDKVTPLVSDAGAVYYRLDADNLAGVENQIVVPASEIIHDRYQPQFHPLIGVSPLFSAALSGALGHKIQTDSLSFFGNGAKPGGILTAPGAISDDTAKALAEQWAGNYSDGNSGRVAVVGDGLKFEPMRAKSIDSQLVEQLKLSSDVVCSTFHVPPYKVGMGSLPTGGVEAINLIYYTDCLQVLIEEMEQCLADGLGLPSNQRITLDIDDLMRMDTKTQFETLAEGVKGSLLTPNEARHRLSQKPITGGDTIYMQQQNYSLEALAKRDSMDDPFSKQGGRPPDPPEPEDALKNITIEQLKEAAA